MLYNEHMHASKLSLSSAPIALLIAILALLPLRAVADEDDPPSRAARLAYAEGVVSFQAAGTDEWVTAVANRPLTRGDALWSDRDSRVELQLDGSLLRLSSQTSVSFLDVSDHVTQIQLSSGTLIVRVRRLDDDETYEVDTPNLAFSILRPGLYRLSVDESGTSTSVRIASGQGEVTGGGAAYPVHAGEFDIFSGADELLETVLTFGATGDPFDAWSAERDSRWDHSESARYVSTDVVGYQDLDDQGDWVPTPEYGFVWFPRVIVPNWAPYHYGHWVYIEPWGYSWVDDQPWGFAPFHYGRWVFARGAWGWIPAPPRRQGVAYVRPVYAPALVAWVGVGAGVGWFALGPREVYVPPHPVSRRYINSVNISNTLVDTSVVTNVYNTTIVHRTVNLTHVTYANRNVPGAIAATSTQAFTTAQPVARNTLRVDPRTVASAPVRSFVPDAAPTRQAVLGAGRPGAPRPPGAIQARPAVARTAPPQPMAQPSLPFERQRPQPALVRLAPPPRLLPAPPPPRSPAPVAIHPRELPPTPPTPSPGGANSVLERQHLQEQQMLRAQQEAERASVQRQQELEHERLAKQQADAARQQQLEQQHQQQTAALAQRHALEQQQLEERQQAQKRLQESRPPPRKPNE